jgi:hypothetical protein
LSADYTVAGLTLLYDVSKFVCYQAPALNRMGRVFARAEKEIAAGSEGPRSQVRCGACGHRVRVDPDISKIVTEARLKESARRRRQGLTVTPEKASATLKSTLYFWLGHAHYLFSELISFLFVSVFRSINRKLGLNYCWSKHRYTTEVMSQANRVWRIDFSRRTNFRIGVGVVTISTGLW